MSKEKKIDEIDEMWEEGEKAAERGSGDIINSKQDETILKLYSPTVVHGYFHYIKVPGQEKQSKVTCFGGRLGKGNDPENCLFCKIREMGEDSDNKVLAAAAKAIGNAAKSHRYFMEGSEGELIIEKKKVDGKVKKRKTFKFSDKTSPIDVDQ